MASPGVAFKGVRQKGKKKQLGAYTRYLVALQRRDKQIKFVKDLPAYDRYIEAVPRKARKEGVHPQTPDRNQIIGRGSFYNQIKDWERAILDWDEQEKPDDELQTSSEDVTDSTSEAASEDFLLEDDTPAKVRKVESAGGLDWESGDDDSDTEIAQSASLIRYSTEREGPSDEKDGTGYVGSEIPSKSCNQSQPGPEPFSIYMRRDNQIRKMKESFLYTTYIADVPRHTRREGVHPQTPDRTQKCDRNEFDKLIRKWSSDVYNWNVMKKKADELQSVSKNKKNKKKMKTSGGARRQPNQRNAVRSAPPNPWSQERQWQSVGNFRGRNNQEQAIYHGLQQGPGRFAPPNPWPQERQWQSDWNFRGRAGLYQGPGRSAPPNPWSQEHEWQSDGNYIAGRVPGFYFND